MEPVLEVEIQREPAEVILAVDQVVVGYPEVEVHADLEASVAKEETTDAAEQQVAKSLRPRRATNAKVKVAKESEMVAAYQWRRWEQQFATGRRRHRNCGTRRTARRKTRSKPRSD